MRLVALAALLIAAPAAADPLQDQVLAGIKRVDTGDVAFTQTTRMEQTGSKAKEVVSRYDPRAPAHWTVLQVDGAAPTAKQRETWVKMAAKSSIPAYSKLAKWFGGPATRVAALPGSVTYRFARLPAGTVKMGSHDASADTIADAVVNTNGPVPFVERVHFSSAKPFRMMLVAKVERYDFTSAYALLPDGRPFPASAGGDISGSMMGKSGMLKTRTRYEHAR